MLAVLSALTVVSLGLACIAIPFNLNIAEYCIQWPPTEQFIMYPRKVEVIKLEYLMKLPDTSFLTGLANMLTLTVLLFVINFYMNLRTLKTLRARTQNRGLLNIDTV